MYIRTGCWHGNLLSPIPSVTHQFRVDPLVTYKVFHQFVGVPLRTKRWNWNSSIEVENPWIEVDIPYESKSLKIKLKFISRSRKLVNRSRSKSLHGNLSSTSPSVIHLYRAETSRWWPYSNAQKIQPYCLGNLSSTSSHVVFWFFSRYLRIHKLATRRTCRHVPVQELRSVCSDVRRSR